MTLKLAIKLADLSHFAKSNDLHMKWNQRVLEEFYLQGDEEEKAGLTKSPFMDRNVSKKQLSQNQVGFIQVIVGPLFRICQSMFASLSEQLVFLEDNVEFWERMGTNAFKRAVMGTSRFEPTRRESSSTQDETDDTVIEAGSTVTIR